MPLPLMMETDAFSDGGIVPPRFGCFGENVQPGFKFKNVPEQAASLALILHDLDVALDGSIEDGLHWTVWNIPPDDDVPEGGLPQGAVLGRNVENRNAYLGPGAPPGSRYHHYVFELFALDTVLPTEGTDDAFATRAKVFEAMQGHVLGKAIYVGLFRRPA